MKEYKPVDSVYEDIYDFDDINGKTDNPRRLGKTFTINEYGEIVRPKHHPRINDDRVHLPPVLIGNPRLPPPTANRSGIQNGRLKNSSAEYWKRDCDWHKEREKLYNNKTSKIQWTNTDHGASTKNDQRPPRPEPFNLDDTYKSLMEGVHDTSILERSPQVLEYERRNHIKPHAPLAEIVSTGPHAPSQNQFVEDVFTKRVREYEERNKIRPSIHTEINHTAPKLAQASVYQPAPPTAPKPESDTSSYTRNRRRLRYSNAELEQDVSTHNPPTYHRLPKSPPAEVEIDYESEVQEALRVQKELDQLHQQIEMMRKARMVNGMEMCRPNTAATANSNLPGCSAPYLTPAAVLHKSTEPAKPWNGDNAKRGLGFKSKIKKEQQETGKPGNSLIPDKIRKQMQKYFGRE